jgi:hypothetical protein
MRIYERVARQREHLDNWPGQAANHRRRLMWCGNCDTRIEAPQALSRSVAEHEFCDMSALSQPSSEGVGKSGLASTWGTE